MYEDEYPDGYRDYYRPPKRRKRKKKSRAAGLVIAVLITLCGFLICVCLLLYTRIPQPRKDLIGTWEFTEDMTGPAVSAASSWINAAILGDKVDTYKYFGDGGTDILIGTKLTLYNNGTYELGVDEKLHSKSQTAAVTALRKALCELISLRIRAAGYDEAYTEETVIEGLINEAVGMSAGDFIRAYGPRMIADLGELKDEREKRGRFSIDASSHILKWGDDGYDNFVLNGDMLSLNGGGLCGFASSGNKDLVMHRIPDEVPDESDKTSGFRFSPVLKAYAREHKIAENLTASTGSGQVTVIKAIDYEYANNRYISIRDLAGALAGTAREFSVTVQDKSAEIDTNGSFAPVGGENEPFPTDNDGVPSSVTTTDLKSASITINGNPNKYYVFFGMNTAGKRDLYMSVTDAAIMFDMNIEVSNAEISIDASTRGLEIDMNKLSENGLFVETRSALAGDASTGKIYAGRLEDVPVAIASTTKLMSYAVIMDAVTAGEITLDDTVLISANAAKLSQGSDRMIPMETGQETNVRELMQAMLIASSNESALALAEYVAGSEEAFINKMNKKAIELGFQDEYRFNNCNGLPVYSDDYTTTKLQNIMSARDMFTLVSHILNVYPGITDITSMKTAALTTLKMDIKSTNALLFNLPEAVGLKTGTTDMAGACLVGASKIEDASGTVHYPVAIVFGAENNTVRFTTASLMLKYVDQCIQNGEGDEADQVPSQPDDAESLITAVLKTIASKN